jgi:hypothetical protein
MAFLKKALMNYFDLKDNPMTSMKKSVLFAKLSASIFKVPEDKVAREYYRSNIRQFLKLLKHHAIVFVDDQGILRKSYGVALDLTSDPEKKLIKTFLAQMKKNGQLISLSIPNYGESCCEIMELIDGQMFCSSRNCQLNNEYLRNESNLADQDLESWQNLVNIKSKETTTDVFENIFDPILKYTKNLQIYDRNIGFHITDDNKVSDNYERGIKSILKRFQEVSIQEKITVKIYTTCRYNRKKDSSEALEKFEYFLANKFPKISISVFGVEGKADEFRHGRMLKSDQFAFYIDRGYDWLDKDEKVRDNFFVKDTDPSGIIRDFIIMQKMKKYYPKH